MLLGGFYILDNFPILIETDGTFRRSPECRHNAKSKEGQEKGRPGQEGQEKHWAAWNSRLHVVDLVPAVADLYSFAYFLASNVALRVSEGLGVLVFLLVSFIFRYP